MEAIIAIIIAALFSQNFVLVQFLGICPFLGVSKKTGSALGMGIAVTLVMVLTCLITYPIYVYVLTPLKLTYLYIIVFIFVIAALVQMLEMTLKKVTPGLYSALGVYLPLVTTNCAILGIAKIVIQTVVTDGVATFTYTYPQALIYGLFAGVGFTLAIVLMAGIRERVEKYNIARPLRGFPITMVVASFMAMAFYIFSFIDVSKIIGG